MNSARTLRGLHPDGECQHHLTSQTTAAQYQLLLLSPDGNQWQTHLFRLQLMVRHCFGWACRLRSNRLGDIPLTQCWLCRVTASAVQYIFVHFHAVQGCCSFNFWQGCQCKENITITLLNKGWNILIMLLLADKIVIGFTLGKNTCVFQLGFVWETFYVTLINLLIALQSNDLLICK